MSGRRLVGLVNVDAKLGCKRRLLAEVRARVSAREVEDTWTRGEAGIHGARAGRTLRGRARPCEARACCNLQPLTFRERDCQLLTTIRGEDIRIHTTILTKLLEINRDQGFFYL